MSANTEAIYIGCEKAILEHVPYYRQTNAYLFDEYKDYVKITIQIHRDHCGDLIEQGAADWSNPDNDTLAYIIDNKPWANTT
mgnify:CR=1 FL=1